MAREGASRETLMSTRADGGFAAYLLTNGKVAPDALARAEQIVSETGERLEHVLTRLGMVSDRDLADAIAGFLTIKIASPKDLPGSPVLEEKLRRSFLRDKQVLPLEERDDAVVVAMVNPLDQYVCDAVRFAVGKPVTRTVIYPADFEAAYARLYGEGKSEIRQIFEQAPESAGGTFDEDIDRLKDIASEAPVIRLVNHLITRAVESRASDIHIEPMQDTLRIRYRIDGVLQQVESPPQHLSSLVISRISWRSVSARPTMSMVSSTRMRS